MTAQTYPGSDTTSQWFAARYPGARFDANCGVLHSTETGNAWPAYGGGATAPTVTVRPDFKRKRLVWRHHFPIDMSARALRNEAGGVETNTANTVQVELVGTCDYTYRTSRREWGRAGVDYLYWPDAPDWALRELARFLLWCETEHGIPAKGPTGKVWMRYPQSYGKANPNRFSHAQWRKHYGWCGHQHVPENTHGDPGDINFARVLWHVADLRAAAAPKPKPAPKPAPKHAAPKTRVVTVKRGQTLSAIAAAAGITLAVILGLNPPFQDDPNTIQPGQRVTVPATAPKTVAPKPKPSPKKPAAKPKPKPRVIVPAPTRALRLNARGADVRRYEACLDRRNLLASRWARDAYYGTTTRAATNRLIRRYPRSLAPADGVAGVKTQRRACAR